MSQTPVMTDAPYPTAASPDTAAPLLNWSEDQLVRLEYEWSRLQRAFAYHPFVRIVSMRDDPPGEYEIEFRVRTLVVGESGDLEYAQAAPVRVWLPPSFPYSAPVVRPLTGLFHPNVSWDGVHLNSAWQPTDTLAVFLKKIGELLAWRLYDPDAIANPLALEWLQQNPTLLPLDREADFAPEAGGQPIERIRKYGPATLQQVRSQLGGLQDALAGAGAAPRPPEVRDFSRRTRVALKLFMVDDVPPGLRREADGLDAWAGALPDSIPAWDFVRNRRGAVEAASAAAAALVALRDPLLGQLAELDALDPPVDPQDAFEALAAIPAPGALEALRLKLPALVATAQDAMGAVRDRLGALDGPLAVALAEQSTTGKRLREELSAVLSQSESGKREGLGVIAEAEPLLTRAAAEAEALRRIMLWREYFDLLHTGRELEKKLAMWGGAGIHAYYIENESGRFGPFQFEQSIELGNMRLAVRSDGPGRIHLLDARAAKRLASSQTGAVVFEIAGSDAGERYPTTFQSTDRCEELSVQLEFLVRQSGQHLEQLGTTAEGSRSWCGRFLGVFADSEAQRLIRDEHLRAVGRWTRLLKDVRLLGPLKARIETWYLVQRLTEAVPRILRSLGEEQKKLRTCTGELAAIIARCTRDIDTDRLVIPPKLARPYTDQTVRRDRIQREIARIEKRLSELGQEAAGRLTSAARFGSNAIPDLQALPPVPQGLSAAASAMDDAALDEQIASLEKLLNVPLWSAAWKTARAGTTPAAEPPSPTRAVRRADNFGQG